MESIKFRDCIKIAQLDATQLSTDVDRFVGENKFAYYVCVNTWCALVYDLSPHAKDILCDQLQHYGVVATVRDLNQCASCITAGTPDLMSPLGKALCAGLDVTTSLQILRFAKRFTPIGADLLEQSTISEFKRVLNTVKLRSRIELPQWICSGLRNIVHDICRGFSAEDLSFDGEFSSGAVVNTNKALAAKVNDWWYPYFLDPLYPLSDRDQVWCPEFPPFDERTHSSAPLDIDRRTSRLITVPKSLMTYRTIAPEDSTRQWMLSAIRKRLERCIQNNGYGDDIPLTDQAVNQVRCYIGSKFDNLATVDLSSASDRLSYALFAEIFPEDVVNIVREWRSSKIAIGDKVYVTHMCATMGSAVCFVVESITFYAFALLATQIVEQFTCEGLLSPTAYGDDITIDVRAYQTVVELLEMCGFKVNVDKSYSFPSPYRESCGVEFWDGYECTTVYFPRKPISDPRDSGDLTVTDSLIKLHNRLFPLSWSAHVFLKSVLRDIIPNVFFTTSTVDRLIDREISDIIDPIELAVNVIEPYDDEQTRYAPAHMLIKTIPDGKPVQGKAIDMYYYVQYLQYGPQYDDGLSELLRVSTSRKRTADRYSKTRTCYGTQADI